MRRGAFLPARANVFRVLRKENLYQHRPRLYNTDDKQEFYKFTQALEALKSTLNGDEKTIILGKDSDLAQILTNP